MEEKNMYIIFKWSIYLKRNRLGPLKTVETLKQKLSCFEQSFFSNNKISENDCIYEFNKEWVYLFGAGLLWVSEDDR